MHCELQLQYENEKQKNGGALSRFTRTRCEMKFILLLVKKGRCDYTAKMVTVEEGKCGKRGRA